MTELPPPIPIFQPEQEDNFRCGPAPVSPFGENERAGYRICRYVNDFIDTDIGPVPQISPRLKSADILGAMLVRSGIRRDGYRVSPGLYCLGNPGRKSPVLVTANYKLTFDTVRRNLADQDVWLMVLDTRGINVWCASAHKTFGTDELLRMIRESGLGKAIDHRRLVVPQLGASGVNALTVGKASGFKIVWGPLRASDLSGFLNASCRIEPEMRKLTFTMAERMVLSPVELVMALKPTLLILVAMFFISGLGPEFFSLDQALERWPSFTKAFLAGLLSGGVLAPALLPWLPFRSFYLKGIVAALPVAGAVAYYTSMAPLEMAVQTLICLTVSSYAAMNFTGATPYASPSGVEKEMRRAIPLQAGMASIGLGLWIIKPFL